jgi:cyclophilin family peptidyl-prolyl cis-trans isomerase
VAKQPTPPADQAEEPTADDILQARLLAIATFFRAHQVKVAWGICGVVLLGVLAFGAQRHFERQAEEATRQLATARGVEPLRRLVEEHGSSNLGPQIRYALSIALLDEEAQLDRNPSGDPGTYQRKLGLLSEAITLLTRLQGEWAGTPQEEVITGLIRQAKREQEWEQQYGKRYLTLTIPPRKGRGLGTVVQAPERPQVAFMTKHGAIIMDLYEDETPNAVATFMALCASGFYDGLTFHRVETDTQASLVQGGDPAGTGSGSAGFTINSELRDEFGFEAGTVAWANRGKHTAASQFFFCTGDIDKAIADAWRNQHTRFGKIVEGLDVAKKIQRGDTILEAKILKRRSSNGNEWTYAPTALAMPGLDVLDVKRRFAGLDAPAKPVDDGGKDGGAKDGGAKDDGAKDDGAGGEKHNEKK